MAATNYAYVIKAAHQHLTKEQVFVTSTLLDLDTGFKTILGSTNVDKLNPNVFIVHDHDLKNVTIMPLFAGTHSSQYLAREENDFWSTNSSLPQWTPQANTTGIPRDWLQQLQAAFNQDLSTVTTKILELNLPGMRDGAPPERQLPGTQTPFPPPPDSDQRARLLSRAADELFQTNLQNLPAAARLSELARPISSFINAGPKTLAATRSVQVSYGEDNNSFTFSTAPQQTRLPETMTASMFHSASLKMQSTVYCYLDLQLFHNNILANYMDKYTMSSILAYEHAVRQLVHDLPPATTFQSVYLELASLHLVSKEEALYRQHVLSLQSSSFQQRSTGPHASQPTASGYRTTQPSVQQRQFTGTSSFPPCQNFATKECNDIINGKCSRDHACAACGKAYPALRCCPAGHKGEEVCPGISEQITQRLFSAKRPSQDAPAGGDKRRRFAN